MHGSAELRVWSYAESSDFSRALRSVFGRIRVEPVTYFNALADEERTDWLFFVRDWKGVPAGAQPE